MFSLPRQGRVEAGVAERGVGHFVDVDVALADDHGRCGLGVES